MKSPRDRAVVSIIVKNQFQCDLGGCDTRNETFDGSSSKAFVAVPNNLDRNGDYRKEPLRIDVFQYM